MKQKGIRALLALLLCASLLLGSVTALAQEPAGTPEPEAEPEADTDPDAEPDRSEAEPAGTPEPEPVSEAKPQAAISAQEPVTEVRTTYNGTLHHTVTVNGVELSLLTSRSGAGTYTYQPDKTQWYQNSSFFAIEGENTAQVQFAEDAHLVVERIVAEFRWTPGPFKLVKEGYTGVWGTNYTGNLILSPLLVFEMTNGVNGETLSSRFDGVTSYGLMKVFPDACPVDYIESKTGLKWGEYAWPEDFLSDGRYPGVSFSVDRPGSYTAYVDYPGFEIIVPGYTLVGSKTASYSFEVLSDDPQPVDTLQVSIPNEGWYASQDRQNANKDAEEGKGFKGYVGGYGIWKGLEVQVSYLRTDTADEIDITLAGDWNKIEAQSVDAGASYAKAVRIPVVMTDREGKTINASQHVVNGGSGMNMVREYGSNEMSWLYMPLQEGGNTASSYVGIAGDPKKTKVSVTYQDERQDEESDVTGDSTSGAGAPQAELPQNAQELADAVLTPQEQQEVQGGAKVEIQLNVENAEPADITEVQQTVEAEAAAGDWTVGQYLDLTLEKIKILNNEDPVTEPVTTTYAPLKVVLQVPIDLQATGRIFSVIRVHEGVTAVLEDQNDDDDPNTITILTDCFSVYAIAYQDSEQGSGGGQESVNPPSGGQGNVRPPIGEEIPVGPNAQPGLQGLPQRQPGAVAALVPAQTARPAAVGELPEAAFTQGAFPVPQTGDETPLAQWAILLAVSLAGLTALALILRRKLRQ